MTGKPTVPKADGREPWLILEVEAVYWAMEAKGYRGADALKALPEAMDILRRLETADGHCSLSEIQSEAFYFLDRLTKKDETDDAA